MEVRFLNPRELKFCAESERIYGPELDPNAAASIRARGIVEPLLAAADMTVVSGNRRLRLALDIGLEQVPVIVDETLTDPDDVLERVIDCNRSTPVSVLSQLRIAAAIKAMEERRALARRNASLRQNKQDSADSIDSANFALSVGKPGKTAQKIAEKLDTGQRTAEMATAAGVELIRAETEGNVEIVKKMENAGSIHAAYRIAQEVCTNGGAHEWDGSKCTQSGQLRALKRQARPGTADTTQHAPEATDAEKADEHPAWFTGLQEMHEGCRQRLNWVIKAMKDVVATPRGEYIAHAQRRMLNHLECAKNCITQMTPAAFEDGKIVTKMDYESRIRGERLQAEVSLKRRARRG